MADKDKAVAAVNYVYANIVYTTDQSRFGEVDYWIDPVGTLYYGEGDCEDMAMLVHTLLLAGGVPSGRLRTYFGYLSGVGHAWVAYKRELDDEWIILDATAGLISDIDTFTPAKEVGVYSNAWAYLTHAAYVTIPAGEYITTLGISEAALEFPALRITASGAHAWTGQGVLPSIQCSGYGNFFGAATFRKLSAYATGLVGRFGVLAEPLPRIRISAHGLTGYLGSASFLWIQLENSAEGYIIPEGSAAGDLPFLTADGYGVAEDRFDDYILRHSR